MSGHSKWSTIKRQKGAADARRASVFTKYARLIAVAARQGGKDPDMNFRLRLAIDKARSVNMPNDNIERAVKSGVGELRTQQSKEALYEGFGPGRVAILAQALTDNTNRTTAELRSLFQKYGGSIGSTNSVAWMFRPGGAIRLSATDLPADRDAFSLELVDAGADDVNLGGDGLLITTPVDRLQTVKAWIESRRIPIQEADLEFLPTTTVAVDEPTRQRLYELLGALDDHPDVTNVFSNEV